MFGLLKSNPYLDSQLGELRRSRGNWKGSLELARAGKFPLLLNGNRNAPHPYAIELAKELPGRFPPLIPQVEKRLFEHYLPGKEAFDAGKFPGPFPEIASSSLVWLHAQPAHILIEPLKGNWLIEVAFRTEWDIEHTVAAIISGWQFIELNGSVR